MERIFVSYNTDSVVEIMNGKYKKLFCYHTTLGPIKNPFSASSKTAEQKTSIFYVSPEEEQERRNVFSCIEQFYKTKNGKYQLYFDILEDDYFTPNLYYHIERNEEIIKKNETFLLLFVVSEKEISFWQLQEAFFASYYDKKILCLTTDKFFYLIKNKKLDRYITSQLKSKK